MLAYHGTAHTGLEELRPFANHYSNLEYPCVYLTTCKPLAAIYIWDKPYKWMNFRFAQDGHVIYTESFPGALEEFYGGLPGSIYTCEGEFEFDKNAKIKVAVISRAPVAVMEEDPVPDALERILDYERQGLLEIRRYEALTQEELGMERRMIESAIKRARADSALGAFIQQKFPALWAARQELTALPMKKEHVAFVVDMLMEESVKAALHLEARPKRAKWEKALRKNLRDPDEANFILYRGSAPAGWLKLNGLEGDMAWISELVVHPAHQRQGVGRFAVRYAERFARESGLGRMGLGIHTSPDNLPARACYEALGYTLTEETHQLTYMKTFNAHITHNYTLGGHHD